MVIQSWAFNETEDSRQLWTSSGSNLYKLSSWTPTTVHLRNHSSLSIEMPEYSGKGRLCFLAFSHSLLLRNQFPSFWTCFLSPVTPLSHPPQAGSGQLPWGRASYSLTLRPWGPCRVQQELLPQNVCGMNPRLSWWKSWQNDSRARIRR